MRSIAHTLTLLVLATALAACGDHPASEPPRWTHEVTPLEGIPRDRPIHAWFDGAKLRTAFVDPADGGIALVVDGKPWPACPGMPVTWGMSGTDVGGSGTGPAVFFAGGGRGIAHVAQANGGVRFVVNQKLGPVFQELWPLAFRADGVRHAYLGRRSGQHVVVLDGTVHARVSDVFRQSWDGWPAFSFSARGGGFGFIEVGVDPEGTRRARAWIGTKPGPWYPDVRSLVFAPDGSDFAYAALAHHDRKWRVVRGTSVGPPFEEVGRLVYSPDGTRLAHYARSNERSGLVIDNQFLTREPTDVLATPVFSGDGKHVAYVESAEGGWRVVVDGKPGATFERVSSLAFMPDHTTPLFIAQAGPQMFPVFGTDRGVTAGHLWPPVVSADGAHRAYRVLGEDGTALVMDGERVAWAERCLGDPVLSPDGASLAVPVTAADGGQRLVIDGEPGPVFDTIEPLDGRLQLGTKARPIRGHASGGSALAPWTHARFDDAGSLRYAARREGRLHLVRVTTR